MKHCGNTAEELVGVATRLFEATAGNPRPTGETAVTPAERMPFPLPQRRPPLVTFLP